MGSQDGSPLRETRKDPFSAAAAECSCRQDGLTVIVTACLTFATGVTVALVMQIYFGDPQVSQLGGCAEGGNWRRGSGEALEETRPWEWNCDWLSWGGGQQMERGEDSGTGQEGREGLRI